MTPAEMIEGLKQFSVDLVEIGTAMDYYGGFGVTGTRGRYLAGVGLVLREWAEEWEGEMAGAVREPPLR